MSFIATANPPAHNAEPEVQNDGFFPAINCENLRKDLRLDGTVTPERLRLAVTDAMISTNAELATWRAVQLDAGRTTLADVPAYNLGQESHKLHLYRKAIYCHVQAQLAESYRDMSTLPEGANKADRVYTATEVRTDGHLQQLRWAIADLQGLPRVIAELL
ncbi:head completion/stabilization protein [Acidovorax sp. GBBC 3334]|uniref:head completion/stabilization protein n=1 Tax=Acidovorax sp. GBBC 3334 TaxID=2940496 RepID=UPI002302E819|nr:head completion/stabilization protein [Acidovorax sp. GBBC 3334]MDA8455247.1 head completion/stabilization protein [Acidovorax sp. GBBC 3334]